MNKDRRNADAEVTGTNSCVNIETKAMLFLKHRNIAKQLQNKYLKDCDDRRDYVDVYGE